MNDLVSFPSQRNREREALILRLRRRGLTYAIIGSRVGISGERVRQYLERLSDSGVSVPRKRSQAGKHRAIVCFKCRGCGHPVTRVVAGALFCSWQCAGAARRQISAADVSELVRRRLSHESWSAIAQSIGFSYQALQRRLWMALVASDNLRVEILEPLWRPTRGHCGYGWLKRSTGITPKSVRQTNFVPDPPLLPTVEAVEQWLAFHRHPA